MLRVFLSFIVSRRGTGNYKNVGTLWRGVMRTRCKLIKFIGTPLVAPWWNNRISGACADAIIRGNKGCGCRKFSTIVMVIISTRFSLAFRVN